MLKNVSAKESRKVRREKLASVQAALGLPSLG